MKEKSHHERDQILFLGWSDIGILHGIRLTSKSISYHMAIAFVVVCLALQEVNNNQSSLNTEPKHIKK